MPTHAITICAVGLASIRKNTRVRQPDVQRHLRRLADCTAEDEQHRDGEECWVARERLHICRDLAEDDRSSGAPDHQDAKHEAEVTDAIGEECLVCRRGRRVALEPVADQQIGADADEFPEDEHHREVVREHDAEHREHEERQIAEVTRLPFVVLHVDERVDVHERAHARDDEQHHLAQGVDRKADRHIERRAEIQPRHLDLNRRHRGKPDADTCQERKTSGGNGERLADSG
jgi:hypothetical protein